MDKDVVFSVCLYTIPSRPGIWIGTNGNGLKFVDTEGGLDLTLIPSRQMAEKLWKAMVSNGIDGLKTLQHPFPEIKVMMQTFFEDDDHIFEAIVSGTY